MMMLRSAHTTIRRFLLNTKGVAAIEIALAMPIFITFMLGIMYLAHSSFIKQSMFYGLDHAGRQAMLTGASNEALEATALSKMSGLGEDSVTIEATDSNVDGKDYKVLTATYTYSFPEIVGLEDITLSSNVTVPAN